MEGRRKNGNRRVALVAGVVCVLVLVAIGVMMWHPWDTGVSGSMSTDGDIPVAGAVGAAGNAPQDDAAMKGDSAYWVIGLFRDLSPVVGSGRFEAWSEVGQDDPHDFSVVLSQSGRCVHFAFSEDYLKMASEAGVEPTIEAFVQDMNEKTSTYAQGGDLFEEAASGGGDFALVDGQGKETPYVASDDLRQFAQATSYQAASYAAAKKAEEEKPPLDEYGLTPGERSQVSIDPDGNPIAKGLVYIHFRLDTTEERVREIVEEQGCNGGSFSLWETENKDLLLDVFTPEGASEWEVAEAFRGYPEVVSAETSPPHIESFDETSSYDGPAMPGVAQSESDAVVAPSSWDSYLQYYLRYSGFDDAWERSRCDGDVTIGVIDSGVDYGCDGLSAMQP